MSWQDKIQSPFTIITGDGKTFIPNWRKASKGIEYNISYFNFIGLSGTLVKRGLPKGTKYAIEIVFQGDNHLEQAEAFQVSAADPRPWTIQHPLYGTLLVQPSDITFGNEEDNISLVTGMLTETISETAATTSTVSAPDKIISDSQSCEQLLAGTCSNDIPNIGTKETTSLLSSTKSIYNTVSKKIKSSADAASYFNAYNKVNGIINSGFYSTIDTIGALHDYLSLPYQFSETLTNRLKMFVDQFNLLNANIAGLFTQQSKKLYEHNAGLSIIGLIKTTVTNFEDAYNNVDDVLNVISLVLTNYNLYISTLDDLQTDNGGDEDSYIPDADALTAIAHLVSYALGNLTDIAAQSRQKRTIFLKEDTNIILLTKQLYGLSKDDSEINLLIETNNIGLNEILGLKKGRKIIYYV